MKLTRYFNCREREAQDLINKIETNKRELMEIRGRKKVSAMALGFFPIIFCSHISTFGIASSFKLIVFYGHPCRVPFGRVKTANFFLSSSDNKA